MNAHNGCIPVQSQIESYDWGAFTENECNIYSSWVCADHLEKILHYPLNPNIGDQQIPEIPGTQNR